MTNRATYVSAIVSIFTWLFFLGASAECYAQQGEPLILGTINFPTSASPQAQKEFETGVLALHSFWYERARDYFRRAQKLEPSFAMAYWGEAMGYDNAFQTETGEDFEQKGATVIKNMDELDSKGKLKWTERERAYFEAIKLRFEPAQDLATNRRNYGLAMDRLVELYPDDDEAKAFAALAMMSFPAFDREQATHVVVAAAPLEGIYQRNPNHPGVLHYLIHVYDTANFAPMGLRQARLYAKIAPSFSYAMHIPSHIFKRLSMWEETAVSNKDSYRASIEWQKRSGRPIHMRNFHAFNWLLDAYLRLGRLDNAKKLMLELDDIESEIVRLNEDPGQFPSIAKELRMAYKSATGIDP